METESCLRLTRLPGIFHPFVYFLSCWYTPGILWRCSQVTRDMFENGPNWFRDNSAESYLPANSYYGPVACLAQCTEARSDDVQHGPSLAGKVIDEAIYHEYTVLVAPYVIYWHRKSKCDYNLHKVYRVTCTHFYWLFLEEFSVYNKYFSLSFSSNRTCTWLLAFKSLCSWTARIAKWTPNKYTIVFNNTSGDEFPSSPSNQSLSSSSSEIGLAWFLALFTPSFANFFIILSRVFLIMANWGSVRNQTYLPLIWKWAWMQVIISNRVSLG